LDSAGVSSLLGVHRESLQTLSCLRRSRVYSFVFGLTVLFLVMASYVLSSERKAFLVPSPLYHTLSHGALLSNLSSTQDSAHIAQVLHRILSKLEFKSRRKPDPAALVQSEPH
ncbi:carbohydrate sulfotransferase 15, partial [Clarias magur]